LLLLLWLQSLLLEVFRMFRVLRMLTMLLTVVMMLGVLAVLLTVVVVLVALGVLAILGVLAVVLVLAVGAAATSVRSDSGATTTFRYATWGRLHARAGALTRAFAAKTKGSGRSASAAAAWVVMSPPRE
jgi:hypothetical protein